MLLHELLNCGENKRQKTSEKKWGVIVMPLEKRISSKDKKAGVEVIETY